MPLAKLQKIFGDEDGAVFHEMAHGRDQDPVKARQVPKSIGCGKSFTAHLQIKDAVKVRRTGRTSTAHVSSAWVDAAQRLVNCGADAA